MYLATLRSEEEEQQRCGRCYKALSSEAQCGCHEGRTYEPGVIDKVAERCGQAEDAGTGPTTVAAAAGAEAGGVASRPSRGQAPEKARKRNFSGYDDPRWWPTTYQEAHEFNAVAGEEVSEIAGNVEYEAEDSKPLWEAINRSDGGMVKVKNVKLEGVWEAMKQWLKDDTVLDRRGGSQAQLQAGNADFQVLQMVRHVPTVLRKTTTLREFLTTRQWPSPVAAVGLSGYGDGAKSTQNLLTEILKLLETMGFETGPEQDVLALAGLDVSGVGVRRPEIYIKVGQSTAEPYWTLRHPEWGGTRGYNTCVAVWEPSEALLGEEEGFG